MLARNEGHIVSIASSAGMYGVAGMTIYCASKFAAVGMAEALYLQLRKDKSKVMSTVVCPYFIDTGMFKGVKTRWPLLLPITPEADAASIIVNGVLKGEPKICFPSPTIHLGQIARVLPVPLQVASAEWLGLSDAMTTFVGRAPADAGATAAAAAGEEKR